MLANLLIAGASVRAQVESALRAGLAVRAFDLFADRDARFLIGEQADSRSSISRLKSFGDILGLEQEWTGCEVGITCGGIESRIELMQALEQRLQLLGPSSEGLGRLLDSVKVNQLLEHELGPDGVNVPRTIAYVESQLESGKWLCKKTGGSGGTGVEIVTAGDRPLEIFGGRYVQEKIQGQSISVLYVSRCGRHASSSFGEASETKVIGVTDQLVGEANLGAGPFQYCGSVGPFSLDQKIGTSRIELGQSEMLQVHKIGEFLARQYHLVGVWGIDFIVNQAGVWPVDVNARLTASAELYESRIASASGFKSVVDLHLKACGHEEGIARPDWDSLGLGGSGLVEGKAVLFNRIPKAIAIDDSLSDALMSQFDGGFFGSDRIGMTVADVPCSGQSIKPGHPILTIRVRCRDSEEARSQLNELAERIYRSF